MATVKQVYSGDDLMIFDGTTNKSWAWAQSHSLSVNIDVVERNTKDNPKSPIKEVSKISYEITTENLYCEDFDTLFAKMITGEYITVKFGKKKNEGDKLPSEGDLEAWTLDGEQNYYVGKFLITSLQANAATAATGEDATYTATFTGCNRIEQKNDIIVITATPSNTEIGINDIVVHVGDGENDFVQLVTNSGNTFRTYTEGGEFAGYQFYAKSGGTGNNAELVVLADIIEDYQLLKVEMEINGQVYTSQGGGYVGVEAFEDDGETVREELLWNYGDNTKYGETWNVDNSGMLNLLTVTNASNYDNVRLSNIKFYLKRI